MLLILKQSNLCNTDSQKFLKHQMECMPMLDTSDKGKFKLLHKDYLRYG